MPLEIVINLKIPFNSITICGITLRINIGMTIAIIIPGNNEITRIVDCYVRLQLINGFAIIINPEIGALRRSVAVKYLRIDIGIAIAPVIPGDNTIE